MENFSMKTKIYMGESSIDILKSINLGKTFIVCDPFMEKSGMVNKIENILEEKNTLFSTFSKIVPNPTIGIVTIGVEAMKSFKPNTVIAFGGGSAIDSAKAMCKIYKKLNGIDDLGLIAIPTTSGTGSEVTEFSVITDEEKEVKYALVDDDMLPKVAILDSQFTMSVPPSVTADTGMDVLTHAIESYVSTKSEDFSKALSEKAIKLVREYIVEVVKNGSNKDAREHMHNASCMAGIAFNTTSLGICHSMAHALGGKFNLSHGRINAMLLPYIIIYNGELESTTESETLSRYVEIANIFGVKSGTKKSTVYGLVRTIRNMMKKIGIPMSIGDTNIDLDEYRDAINEMAINAMNDNCTGTNPRRPSVEDIEKIYLKLLDGRLQ